MGNSNWDHNEEEGGYDLTLHVPELVFGRVVLEQILQLRAEGKTLPELLRIFDGKFSALEFHRFLEENPKFREEFDSVGEFGAIVKLEGSEHVDKAQMSAAMASLKIRTIQKSAEVNAPRRVVGGVHKAAVQAKVESSAEGELDLAGVVDELEERLRGIGKSTRGVNEKEQPHPQPHPKP